MFHAINKNIEGMLPELSINGIIIEPVQNFNFLGLLFNEHMFWKPHIDIIANKLMKFSGILNKLKNYCLAIYYAHFTSVWFNRVLHMIY